MVKQFTIASASHCAPHDISKLRIETTNGNVIYLPKRQIDKKLNSDSSMIMDEFWTGLKMEVDFYDVGDTIPGTKPTIVKEGWLINRPMAFRFLMDTPEAKNAFTRFNDEIKSLKIAGITFVSAKQQHIHHSHDDEPDLPIIDQNSPQVAGSEDDLPF